MNYRQLVHQAEQTCTSANWPLRNSRRFTFPSTGISPSIEARSLELSNHLAEHSARLAREQSEEREMVRLTGQMTAQSAETLEELADAASTMLEKLDQPDEESKRTTTIQLWIAVDRALLADVVKHKKVFYSASYANYDACLAGQLKLIPEDAALAALRDDFQRMIGAGMFINEPPTFDAIIDRLHALETAINQ